MKALILVVTNLDGVNIRNQHTAKVSRLFSYHSKTLLFLSYISMTRSSIYNLRVVQDELLWNLKQ